MVHRVYRLPKSAKETMTEARDRRHTTTRAWLREATTDTLPALVAELAALGLSTTDDAAPCRWRFDHESLTALQGASKQTGLPQTMLLSLLVAKHATASAPRRVRRTKRSA
jgi:hypothetical protein